MGIGREDSAFNYQGLIVTKKTVRSVQSRRQCLTKKESKVRTEMQEGGQREG